MLFSIIIPVKEINSYLKESVPRILELDYLDFEVLIMPDSQLAKSFFWQKVKIISTGNVGPAAKRNLGGTMARGDILAFLDDDAYPAKDWLKNAAKLFKKYSPAAVAGPNLTPPDSSIWEKVSGEFFVSSFGSGTKNRYTPGKKLKCVDDWPTVNLLVNRKIFIKLGGFDENFWPGEDTKFCLDLVKSGEKILYSPQTLVYHHRRPTLKSHLKQVSGYGFHRGYFAKKYPATSFKFFYFVPSLFVIYLFAISILGLVFRSGNFLFFLPLFVYLLILIYNTLIAVGRQQKWQLFFLLPIYFFLSHITYGLNFIVGLCYCKDLKSKLRQS